MITKNIMKASILLILFFNINASFAENDLYRQDCQSLENLIEGQSRFLPSSQSKIIRDRFIKQLIKQRPAQFDEFIEINDGLENLENLEIASHEIDQLANPLEYKIENIADEDWIQLNNRELIEKLSNQFHGKYISTHNQVLKNWQKPVYFNESLELNCSFEYLENFETFSNEIKLLEESLEYNFENFKDEDWRRFYNEELTVEFLNKIYKEEFFLHHHIINNYQELDGVLDQEYYSTENNYQADSGTSSGGKSF